MQTGVTSKVIVPRRLIDQVDFNNPGDASRGWALHDLEQLARQVLAAQPFSRLVRARLTGLGDDHAELTVEVRQELTQQHGFVHGGVVSYLADNALTIAGGLALGSDALTAEYKINYVRPAAGSSIVARARAESTGSRQAVCRCDVYSSLDGGVRLCAVALGTVIALPRQRPRARSSTR